MSATWSSTRTSGFPEFPNVPTARESGFAEAAKFRTLLGFYIHKNTPEEFKKFLFDAFKKTFDDPAFKKAFDAFGEDDYLPVQRRSRKPSGKRSDMTVPLLKEWGLYRRQVGARHYESA